MPNWPITAQRGSYAAVLLDIDHFKRVNDEHGHVAGDAALLHLVRLLRADLREVDLIGRWGGEEFLLLLPDAGLSDARLVAERLRSRARKHAAALAGAQRADHRQLRGGGLWTLRGRLRAARRLAAARQGARAQLRGQRRGLTRAPALRASPRRTRRPRNR
jgi:GGDEF domain-containing protein